MPWMSSCGGVLDDGFAAKSGMSARAGLRTGASTNWGGVIGTVLDGHDTGRIRPHSVLITAFLPLGGTHRTMEMSIG